MAGLLKGYFFKQEFGRAINEFHICRIVPIIFTFKNQTDSKIKKLEIRNKFIITLCFREKVSCPGVTGRLAALSLNNFKWLLFTKHGLF